MKKILSRILGISVVLSMFFVLSVSVNAKDNFNKMSIELLEYLEIIEETDGMSTEPITRAQFSEYLAKALKMPQVTDKIYFKDVPQDFWGAGAINALYEAGIISPAYDGNFNPDSNITYEQICKMMVTAAGYEDFSQNEGSKMTSYVITAKKSGIESTPKDVNNIAFDEAMEMMFEGMFITMPEISASGIGGKRLEVEEDGETLFSVHHDIYKSSGQLRSLYGMSIDGMEARENEALIDDEIYETIDDLTDYFGQEIDFIYTEDKNEDKTVICAVEADDSKVVIKSHSIEGIDTQAGRLQYYPEGNSQKSKILNFDPKSNVIFNGSPLSGRLSEKIEEFKSGECKGTITFIESEDSNNYDLIIIKSYEIFTVGMHDTEKNILYSYYGTENKIEIEKYKCLSIKDANGFSGKLPTSFPASLMVAESENGESLEIISCTTKKQITIKGINAECEIETSDGIYKFDENLYDKFAGIIRAGEIYNVTLDNFSEIVYITSEESSQMHIGWIRKAYISEDNNGYNYGLLIFNYDENLSKRYDFAKRVVTDGENYSESKIKELFLAFPGETGIDLNNNRVIITPQLIRFSLNSEGEIATVDTENIGKNEDERNSLYKIDEGERYFSASHGWHGINNAWVSGKTKTMQVPVVNAEGYVEIGGEKRYEDDTMYKINVTPSDWYLFDMIAYKWSDDSLIADMIVTKRHPSTESVSTHVFNKITKEVDSEGETREVLNVFTDGVSRKYFIDSVCINDAKALNTGDIVKLEMDFSGEGVTAIIKMFDAKTRTFGTNGNVTDPNREWYTGTAPAENTVGGLGNWRNTGPQLAKGYASVMRNGMIGIAFTLSDARDGKWTMPVSGMPVIIYDEEAEKGDKLYIGSMNDIRTYEMFGEDCSYIVYGATTGKVRHIVVYR